MRDLLARLWRGIILVTASILTLMMSIGASLDLIKRTVFDYPFVGFFLGALVVLVCYVVHELGHAIGAWLVGWRVHLMAVGFVGYAPQARRLSSKVNLPDTAGGMVFATPPKGSAWRQGNVIFILGGAAANFLFGAVLIISAQLWMGQQGAAFPFMMVVGVVSIIFGAFNLIPVWGPGRHENDGAQLISAIRGLEPSAQDQLKARLLGMVLDEVPLTDWDQDVVEALLDGRPADREEINPFLFRYFFARNDFQRARELFEQALRERLGLDPDLWFLYAFLLLLQDGQRETASAILRDHAVDSKAASPAYLLATCALNHLNGNKTAALAAVERMHARLDHLGLSLGAYDIELLRAVKAGDRLPLASPDHRLSLAS